ncbi:MAG: hypothetical protein ACM3OF_06275 [Gemmatimonas sp.]
MWTVLTSEFFWVVIVGLFLSFAGAYTQTIFTAIQSRRERKDLVKNFCADTIKNLHEIVDEMAEHRSKANVIHPDYLGLLHVEIGVFGRNRENLIVLPEQLRDDIRTLANANKSLDTLIVRASGSTSLIDQIKSAQ